MGDWVGWVVYALAVARFTGLVTADELTRPPREAILRKLNVPLPDAPDPDDARWVMTGQVRTSSAQPPTRLQQALGTLITCQWCASVWIAAVAAPLIWWHGTALWLFLPALALALSEVAGLLSDVGRR